MPIRAPARRLKRPMVERLTSSMARPAKTIATSTGLAAYHAARTRLYGLVYDLLRRAPNRGAVESARILVNADDRRYGPTRSRTELGGALGRAYSESIEADHARLFGGAVPLVPLRCERPGGAIRGAASGAARLPEWPEWPEWNDRLGEIRVLAGLADRTAWALSRGELEEAARLTELQGRVLHEEAGRCLTELSRALESQGGPFYARIGRALRRLVEDDVRLLGQSSHSSNGTRFGVTPS